MTRLFLLLITFIAGRSSIAQNNFQNFVSDLKELQLPLVIDDKLLPDTLLVNRQQAWDYLIVPVTGLNHLKEEWKQFQIDTTLILLYRQWNNIDLHKKEGISIYSPIFNGRLYCNGIIRINKEITGIIWSYYETDYLYGNGSLHYLFTYDKYGKLLDFSLINCNQNYSEGLWNSETHQRTEMENNTIKITSEFATVSLFDTSYNTIKHETRFITVTDKGLFEEVIK